MAMHTYDAAEAAGATTEVLVSNSVVTALPTTALAGRRWVEIQNLGPNAIYVTVSGSNPVATKSRTIAASGGVWVIPAGPGIAIKALAATAAQLTGAATIVTELA